MINMPVVAETDVPIDGAAAGSNIGNDSRSNQSNEGSLDLAAANSIHPLATREEFLLNGLRRLDHQYQEMWEQQRIMFQALESLEKDELVLEEALVRVQEPAKKKPQHKDAQALQRLQESLLAAGSSSDDDDDDDDDSEDYRRSIIPL
jgi:hypothetical protein